MLTVEEVTRVAYISVACDCNTDFEAPTFAVAVMGDILYQHGGKLHRLSMKFTLPSAVDVHSVDAECKCREAIDWKRFTEWVNRHDDIQESDTMEPDEWSHRHAKNKEMREGRNGCYNTITNKVEDYSHVVLV